MKKHFFIALVLLGLGSIALAQNDYYMSNATVSDCKGNFYDSDNGLITGDYDHNEDYIFTICVPNAASITLSFTSFCTESVEDFIIIYDGPDT
ncbi:MAG: hypothetical protein JJ975_14015, partial [Bacteroidia bacterium]|nr:hypothetical protein [Bacteroidia bacterium]